MTRDELDTSDPHAVRDRVRERYTAAAESTSTCCGPAPAEEKSRCCGSADTAAPATGGALDPTSLETLGYTASQAASAPEGSHLGLGCGNPLAHTHLAPGETVLDLGSGAGVDVFLAAREVGPQGRAIGVDMTHAMLARARATAARDGFRNVDFRLGEIEHLPLADGSIDVVISNCVINLSPDKPQVFREIERVLRPGGRMVVSDLVLNGVMPPELRASAEAWAGCVAGALPLADYLAAARDAGLDDVRVLEEVRGPALGDAARRPDEAVAASLSSVRVGARKRSE